MNFFTNLSFEQMIFLVPLFILGGVASLIMAERVYRLFFDYPLRKPEAFFQRLRVYVMDRKIAEAIAFCETFKRAPAARVAKEGLMRAHQAESFIDHGLELAVGEAIQKIQARTAYLATIANVATLLGLCGTVMGLIRSFGATAESNGRQASVAMAQGISEAMTSTLLGLALAIVCVLSYSFLMTRTRKLSFELNSSAVHTLDLLKESKLRADSDRSAA